MRVEKISFIQGEVDGSDRDRNDFGAVPAEITVTMSITEAAVIAQVFGGFSDLQFEKLNLPIIHPYSDLSGDVFNRYWDDGVDGAVRYVRGLR